MDARKRLGFQECCQSSRRAVLAENPCPSQKTPSAGDLPKTKPQIRSLDTFRQLAKGQPIYLAFPTHPSDCSAASSQTSNRVLARNLIRLRYDISGTQNTFRWQLFRGVQNSMAPVLNLSVQRVGRHSLAGRQSLRR